MASIEITELLKANLANLGSMRREAVVEDNPIVAEKLRAKFREECVRFLDYMTSEIERAELAEQHPSN